MNDRDIEDTRQPYDEPEEEYCPECGKAMEEKIEKYINGQSRWTECTNLFCPSKHEKIAKEMAEYIVELTDTLERLENRVKFLSRKITALEFQRDEKGD